MNNFTFQYPVRQHFGKGCAEEAIKKELNAANGINVMLAYGGGSIKRSGLYEKVKAWLIDCGKKVIDFGGIMPNPTYAKVQEGAQIVRENNVDFILAVGGGSVIDCCKIVSAQALLDEDIWTMEYDKHLVPTKFIPMGAVVTASGTGAEQNNGAVITNEALQLKQALFGAYHSFAVLDSDLTLTLPMKQVICGAFDTLSHCMETYMGKPQATNISDEINEAVQRSVIKNLRALIIDHRDDFARGELMWASAMAENGMLKLGKQTDFQCHMIEHAVGAFTNCNHGQGLAVIHPAIYRRLVDAGTIKLARMARKVWGVKAEYPESVTDYDVIFIGSPIWWHNPAMVVCTFLEHYDLKDKIVVPFFTYGSTTYLQASINKIYESTPESTHLSTYTGGDVTTWLRGINIIE